MNFKPTYDNLLIKEHPPVTQIGNITIPGNAHENHIKGTVVQAGPGMYNEAGIMLPLQVKAGDVILFPKASAKETKLNGESFLILKETDVIGILEE